MNTIEQQPITRPQTRLSAILGLPVVTGAAGAIWGEMLPREWLRTVAKDLRPGLFTAGLLGLTVNRFHQGAFAPPRGT
jgi:hypothetical protein